MQGRRLERVASLIREELADLMVRQLKDPSLQGVTVTGVKVSPDLAVAQVSYAAAEGSDQRRLDAGLGQAAPFLRRELGSRLRLKRVPELRFCRDEAFERGLRVEQILREISTEPSAPPSPPKEGEEP